jgi:hypothetical protein
MGGKTYPEGRRMNFFNPNIIYKYITADIQDKAIKEKIIQKKRKERLIMDEISRRFV